MPAPSWLSRLGHSRSFRLLGSYFAASWVILQLTALLREELNLQTWLVPTVLVFLAAGLVVICAVLWARTHPISGAIGEEAGDLDLDERPSILRRILEGITPGRGMLAGAGVFVGLVVVSALLTRDKLKPEDDPPDGDANGAEVDSAGTPAERAFREGERRFRRADFQGALDSYREALRADSSLAMAAYRRMTVAPHLPPLPADTLDRWSEGAGRMPDALPEPHAAILRAQIDYDGDGSESLRVLEAAVASRPRDAEAWYGLAELHLRRGTALDAERALERAVALDSLHGPACLRLIQVHFGEHPAAAENGRLLAGCLPAVRGGPREAPLRLLGDLTTQGGSRASALAALDTLPADRVTELLGYLSHPSLWDVQGDVLVRRRDRPEVSAEEASFWTTVIYFNRLQRGRVGEAMGVLDDRRLSALVRAELVYSALNAGLPLPRQRLERYLGPASAGAQEDFRNFYLGAAALEEGRSADYETALRRLQRDASQFAAEGDEYAGTLATEGARALRGQALRLEGRLEEAFRILEDAHARTLHTGPGLNSTIGYWLGELSLERGRPWQALDFFNLAESRSVAAEALGQAYERFGDPDAARDAYAWLPVAWRNADPALQPRVDEARRAVARLEGGSDP